MASLRMRVRGPSGQSIVTIATESTWGDLKKEISKATSIDSFDLKYGFPPQPLGNASLDADIPLSSLGVSLNGEQLTVVPHEAPPKPDPSNTQTAASSSSQPDQPLSLSRKQDSAMTESELPEIPVPQLDGVLTLRVMPDDNSCLFRALSTALLGASLDGMTELRSIVAQKIQADPDFYTAGVLEKPPDEYCRWIQHPDSWGGGIELSILSTEFGVEVCSINVQDLRVDRFNEGKEKRVIVVYSGIHYDVVAVTPYGGADPEQDRKVFDVLRIDGEEMDGGALEAARELCKTLQQRHYYTDTKGFDLVCNICGWKGKGEKGATAHAKETSHMDFGEA
ncbi:Ubiquitin thioesterase otu1-like protein [Elsinoe fawcettii]|nr:Ubiquitin thioesterase otu1-like protein [Elsinoe fawcettii]